MTISPTGRKALTHLAANEARGIATHRTAFHQSAREALLARGLIEWDGPHLRLTDTGRDAAGTVAA